MESGGHFGRHLGFWRKLQVDSWGLLVCYFTHIPGHVMKNLACYEIFSDHSQRISAALFSKKCRKKATKILPVLKNLSYSEKLKICQKTTFHYRRITGDMMETYKIVTGKYETCVAPSLSKVGTYVTRGNDLRLKKFRAKCDLRKYSFSVRVVNIWNSLLNCMGRFC